MAHSSPGKRDSNPVEDSGVANAGEEQQEQKQHHFPADSFRKSSDRLISHVMKEVLQAEQHQQQEKPQQLHQQHTNGSNSTTANEGSATGEAGHRTPSSMRVRRKQQQQQETNNNQPPSPLLPSFGHASPIGNSTHFTVKSAAATAVAVTDVSVDEEEEYNAGIEDSDDDTWLSPTAGRGYRSRTTSGVSEFNWDDSEDLVKPSEGLSPSLRAVHATAVEVMRRSSRIFESVGERETDVFNVFGGAVDMAVSLLSSRCK